MFVCGSNGCGHNKNFKIIKEREKKFFWRKLFLNALCVFSFTLSPRRWDPCVRRNLYFSVAASWASPFSASPLSHSVVSLISYVVSCHLVPSIFSAFLITFLIKFCIFLFYILLFSLPTSTFSPRIFSHCNLRSLSLLSSCCAFHCITSLACTLFCISFSLVFTSFRLSPSTKKI